MQWKAIICLGRRICVVGDGYVPCEGFYFLLKLRMCHEKRICATKGKYMA